MLTRSLNRLLGQRNLVLGQLSIVTTRGQLQRSTFALTQSTKNISAMALSQSPTDSSTTLVQALDHIPRFLKPTSTGISSDGDLTPPPNEHSSSRPSTPPILEADVEEFTAQVASAGAGASSGTRGRGRRGGQKSYAEHEPEEEIELPLKARGKRQPTKIKVEMEGEAEENTGASSQKGRRKTPKKVAAANQVVKTEEEEEEEPLETPKRGRKKATKAVKVEEEGEEGEGEGSSASVAGEAITPKKRKPTPKKSRIAVDEPEYDEDGNEIIKKKRKVKEYPKIEYDIPPVERKETTFRGRLGYACLNTVLRKNKPESIFCSRTCRIASIKEEGLELPKGLALMNAKDLKTMIEWNEQNKIRFMRLSSEMFPFASHAEYGYDLSFAAAELKEAGDLAKKYGHRLTMHPGQFTQLGSPKPNVVTASVRELNYQCEILDRMGLDKDSVMIIHMGGIYGDKESTLARFKENFATRLEEHVKARVVLENDEICYNVDDILPVCNELNIPIVFDYHHDWIYPSSEPPSVLIPKIAETWKKRGIRMKQHLSEPRPGAESVMERRAHADRCKSLPPDLPDDVDLMIEAKDKEQAVFELYRIYGLEDVIHDNLRPPDANPSMQTKGRKSSTKRKTKDLGGEDSDGNSVILFDVEKEGDGDIGDEGVEENRQVESQSKPEKKKAVRKAKKIVKAVEKTEPMGSGDEEVKEEVEVDQPVLPAKKRSRKSKVEVPTE